MKRFSVSTLIGLGIGLFCVVSGIYGAGHLSSFVNFPSIFIICGGSAGALITSFPMRQLKTLGSVMWKGFKREKTDFEKDIQIIVDAATIARTKGILALEEVAQQHRDDHFLSKGIQLVADGTKKESVVKILKTEIFYLKKRHQDGHAMLDMLADSVTSLGLLGTYIGLIPMLENLEDPASLGPLMAIELVSSFYGAFLSYVIFGPLAHRLKTMSSDEVLRNMLIIDGLTDLVDGKNPRYIEEHLVAALTKKQAERVARQSKVRNSKRQKKKAA